MGSSKLEELNQLLIEDEQEKIRRYKKREELYCSVGFYVGFNAGTANLLLNSKIKLH